MFFQFFQCFQFSFFQTCFFLKTFSFFWRFFTFFCKNFSPSGHFTRHLLKHRFFLQKAKIKARFWVREEEERRKKKEEGRTRQQKQVSFHNRTHRIFLFFACVETPLSDNIIQNFAVYRDYVFFHPIACKTTARCRPPIGPSKFHWGPRQIRPCRWPSRSHRSSMRPDFTWDRVFSFCATSSSINTLHFKKSPLMKGEIGMSRTMQEEQRLQLTWCSRPGQRCQKTRSTDLKMQL